MSVLLLVSVVELVRYYVIRSDPSQEALARRSFRVGGSAALLFSVILFLSPLLREVFETLFNLGILGCLFLALESLMLSTMVLFINIFYFIRYDPEKTKQAHQAYNVSVLACILFFLLLFIYISIV